MTTGPGDKAQMQMATTGQLAQQGPNIEVKPR
jgi:hypothetical protein